MALHASNKVRPTTNTSDPVPSFLHTHELSHPRTQSHGLPSPFASLSSLLYFNLSLSRARSLLAGARPTQRFRSEQCTGATKERPETNLVRTCSGGTVPCHEAEVPMLPAHGQRTGSEEARGERAPLDAEHILRSQSPRICPRRQRRHKHASLDLHDGALPAVTHDGLLPLFGVPKSSSQKAARLRDALLCRPSKEACLCLRCRRGLHKVTI